MVAAAKLRRAQTAAEAARPFAERMDSVMARPRLGRTVGTGPALLAGTGKDDVHLLVVCTAERGLCGRVQLLHRARRGTARRRCRRRARRSRSCASARRVRTVCAAIPEADHRRHRPARDQDARLRRRRLESARRIIAPASRRASSTSARCSTRASSSVVAQIPTAMQLIPLESRRRRRRSDDTDGRRVVRVRARRGDDPRRAAAPQHRGAGVSRASSRMRRPSRARA